MANEAVLLTQIEPAFQHTVANATGIEKGALCKLSDPNTAALADGDADKLAGIAASEKIASDGNTKLGFYKRGMFSLTCSGAVVVGEAVVSVVNFPNYIAAAGITASGACILGHAMETGAVGETIRVYVNVGVGGNQVS